MCYFLTVAVPSRHADKIADVFGRGYLTFPTENRSVMEALPNDFSARLVTSGMCSCGLYFRQENPPDSNPAAELKSKYEKRGWSTAKTQRAIEQAKTAFAKRPRPVPGVQPDVIERLVALCQASSAVAALAHWYDDDVETTRLPLKEMQRCDLKALPAAAQDLVEDQILLAKVYATSR